MTCSQTSLVLTVLLHSYMIIVLSHSLIGGSFSFPEPFTEDKDYALSYNLVEPTTPSFRTFWRFYSKPSKGPSPVKSIVKALYILDTKLKIFPKTSSSTKRTDFTPTGPPLYDAHMRNSPQVKVTLNDDWTRTSSAPVIVPLNNAKTKQYGSVGALLNDDRKRTSPLVKTLFDVAKSTTSSPFRTRFDDLWDSTSKDLPHSELDKSERFTHSILYGYGLEH